MHWFNWFWVVLGFILIAAGLLDLFLSALDYDDSGELTRWVQGLLWYVLRGLFRRLPMSWRRVGRAQILGLQILVSLTVWVGLEIVGFGFVFYGLMYGHNFSFSGSDIGQSMDYALYFSTGQLSTVGGRGVTPENTLLRSLSVFETLVGLALITLAIGFLSNVFQTISYLRSLASTLYYAAPGADDPVSSLATYFPNGQPQGLSTYLGQLYQNLDSYVSGLRLHHTAYYYQSRNPNISLVYIMHMLGGVVGALRWGLPETSSVSDEPSIAVLTNRFGGFLSYLDEKHHWHIEAPPPPVPCEVFTQAYVDGTRQDDEWLNRFLTLKARMQRLTRSEQAPDPQTAYRQYTEWLPVAHRTKRTVERLATSLAYDVGEEMNKLRDEYSSTMRGEPART